MKFKVLIISFFLILSGCANISIFDNNNILLGKKKEIHKFNNNYSVTGVVKFKIQDKNFSSRFEFLRKNREDKIRLLDIFNNNIVSFNIEENFITIQDYKKNKKTDELKKIVNRPIFKNIFINFSDILSQNIQNPTYTEKYKNGLYKQISNNDFVIYYISYNKKNLVTKIKIEYLKIVFNLKISNWKFD